MAAIKDDTEAGKIMAAAKAAGGRPYIAGKVDLRTVKRKLITWYSMKVLTQMGVPPKPMSGNCPICGQATTQFELDHMSPWRVYVAALGGGKITVDNGKLLIDKATLKALYNDTKNLWWIGKCCNSKKSDMVYDTAAQLQALQSGTVPDGQKGDPMDLVD